MNEIGLERLSTAIVILTMQDYLLALRTVRNYKGQSGWRSTRYAAADYMIADCETFFRKDLDYFTSIDGEYLMKEIQEKSYDKHFKIIMEG